jgi:tRNA dimethylallyltransferase
VHPVSKAPLLVIAGPTGSGKTALSLALAARFAPAEIVSCDSVAVYRGFEIGTAKPARADRERIPHHLIDIADPDAEMTAGEYARQARIALHQIKDRGALPIVVGGTGLYLKALLDGLDPIPPRSESLREELRQKPAPELHALLQELDRAAAARIHTNDIPKLVRAIEVARSAQKPLSEHFGQGREPLEGFVITLIGLDPDREALYTRVNERCAKMFSAGLVEETRTLLADHPDRLARPNSPLNALGYKQAVAHIRGELSLDDAISATAQAHRNYAKRQLTWFRNQHRGITWLNGFGDEAVVLTRATELLAAIRA